MAFNVHPFMQDAHNFYAIVGNRAVENDMPPDFQLVIAGANSTAVMFSQNMSRQPEYLERCASCLGASYAGSNLDEMKRNRGDQAI